MKRIFLSLSILITVNAFSQSVTVLPQNGSYDQSTAPQGSSRFQRQFYLITPAEMQKAGFNSSMQLNAIGFTNGVAQSSNTKGSFKLYLKSTNDTKSKLDTSWTTISTATNSYHLTGLIKGDYEWQVIPVCSGTPIDTGRTTFSNNNLSGCNLPTNLTTDGIAASTATLHWVAPASPGIVSYVVQYRRADTTANWITDTVTSNSKSLSGLVAGKNYQWSVKTLCSAATSDIAIASFVTDILTAGCNNPGALSAGSITGTGATLSWTAASSGASYYTIFYRRIGTISWTSKLAFTTSSAIIGLTQGTTYEWKVRTVCALGNGAFIAGTNFTTTGTTACFAPIGLSTDSLTQTSALLSWSSTGAASYTVRYRLKEYINWTTTVAQMTQVIFDSITIPNTIGAYNLTFDSVFNHTGGGLYVAFEYTKATGPVANSQNTALCTTGNLIIKGSYGQDSIRYVLSLGNNTPDTLAEKLPLVNFRPETRFSSPAVKDSVEVAAVYALGHNAIPFSNNPPIKALIKNHSDTVHTYSVSMVIKDAASGSVRFGPVLQSVTVAKHNQNTVSFSGWVSSKIETDSIIVSVSAQPNENYLLNNSSFYIQNNNSNLIGYDDGAKAITQIGFDTLSGLILAKYYINGCGKVNGAQIYLSNSSKGHAVHAVLVDTAENIIATSNSFTPDSSQINGYHLFYFPNSPLLKNVDYYVGLAQTSTTAGNGYFPVGVQWEGETIRSGAYFKSKLSGDSITENAMVGRLMIKAELVAGFASPVISGSLNLCTGTSILLKADAVNRRYADSVIAFSTQSGSNEYSANAVLGAPNVYPDYGLNAKAWASSTDDGRREFLTLRFPNPSPINVVEIYETFNPGAVDSILVKDTAGNFILVWSDSAKTAPKKSRINRISFPLTGYNVSEIMIKIASDLAKGVRGFNCIDAVGIGVLTSPGNFSSVLWSPGGETTTTKTVTIAQGYKLTATDAVTGCIGTDSVTIVTPVQVVPVITPRGSTTFCSGDSLWLVSDKKGGNTWSTGSTKDSIAVKNAGTYSVSYNDGSGCGNLTSVPVTISLNALPNVTISGALIICPGGTTTLDAGSGYSSYLWSTGATSQTINVTNSGAFNVNVTNSNGCKKTVSVNTTVTPNPTPSISGNLTFCPGASTILDAGAGYSSYLWNTGNLADTTRYLTVSTARNIGVTVTNAGGCSGTTSRNTTLFTAPVPFITGNNGFCPGGTVVISGNGGFTNYLWSTGATSQSITVSTVGTDTLTVTDFRGCTGTATKSIVQFANPTPIITGALSFCSGTASTLDAGLGYASYLWSPGGETTHDVQATTAQVYSVTVTSTQGCTGTASGTATTQGAIPATPGPISGPTNGICGTSGNVYTISPVADASYYVWTVPTGATITNGQNTLSITVSYGSGFTGGDIIVAATNACGQSPSLTPRILTLGGAPAIPGAITGQISGLCHQVNNIYSIPPMNNGTIYSWSIPAGATIVNGSGTNAITVIFNTGFGSGDICVNTSTSCGSGGTSCINVVGLINTPSFIDGPSVVCTKQRNVAYSTPLIIGAASYTWTVPKGAKVYRGQGTNNIIVNFSNKAGKVSVRANSVCGYSGVYSMPVTLSSCIIFVPDVRVAADNDRISVYPNPSNGIFTLDLGKNTAPIYHLQLFDAIGKMVYSNKVTSGIPRIRLNLSNLIKGLYYMNVFDGVKTTVVKLVIQ